MAKCTGMRRQMQHGYKVGECNHTDCPYRTETITNADRIRAMSDEELAKFLPSICSYARKEQIERNMCVKAECEKCLLEWFKQHTE